MKRTPALLTCSLVLFAFTSSAAWRGEVSSSNGASGRAASYDAACFALAADIGRKLAAESKTYLLFREDEHSFDARTGQQIARVWLLMRPDLIRRQDFISGDAYACEVTLVEAFPNLTTVRRDLLTDRVLSDRRIHPLILFELVADEDEREPVVNAFADRLSSPVLSDYFLNNKITACSPSAVVELNRYPEILDELPPPELLLQLQALPGYLPIMKRLLKAAEGEGRSHIAKWLNDRKFVSAKVKEPKIIRSTWPHAAERARNAHDFVTPALRRFYAEHHVAPYGSARQPEDDYFAKAGTLVAAGCYRAAYEQYLHSIDLTLSYDACLGASTCASHDRKLQAEADFFLLQAWVIDRDREPVRERLLARERQLADEKGVSDD